MQARSSFAWASVLMAGLGASAIGFGRRAPAEARPPAGVDLNSPEAHWFQELRQPQNGASCCDVSDCRKVTVRSAGDHWEFYADLGVFGGNGDNEWHVIPETKWLRGKDNPTGETVVCWDPRLGVLCAVKPTGA